jgi:hypothetical protein
VSVTKNRSNNSTSAYDSHILKNRHEYGKEEHTLKLLKKCQKELHMDRWEALFIQTLHHPGILIEEQQFGDPNPLYKLAQMPQTL